MQRLPDVAQVGHPAFPVGAREHAGRQVLHRRHRLQKRRHPLPGKHVRPATQQNAEGVHRVVAGLGEPLRGPAEEGRECGRPHPTGPLRLLDCFEQDLPLPRHRRAEHARRAGDDGGHAHLPECLANEVGLHVGARQHCDVARSQWPLAAVVVEAGTGGQQPGDVGRGVLGDEGTCRGREGQSRRPAPHLAARHDTQAQGRSRGRVEQPAALMGSTHLAVHDPGVAEGCPGEHHVQRVYQRLVAAPVGRQRRCRIRRCRRLQVSHDVGATEGVDGLLGVADEHERPVTVKGRRQDFPLHGIGVLELVNQRHPEP